MTVTDPGFGSSPPNLNFEFTYRAGIGPRGTVDTGRFSLAPVASRIGTSRSGQMDT